MTSSPFFVTIETVGEHHYRNSPIAHNAVRGSVTKTELIRVLLDENEQLRKQLIDATQFMARPVMIVHQPGQQLPIVPPRLTWKQRLRRLVTSLRRQ